MAVEEEITTSFILTHRQSRWRSSGAEELDTKINVVSPKEIKKAAAVRFSKACDSGIWKRLTSVLLEPGNPLDHNAPRRFRREAVVVGGMVLSFLLLALYFNFLGGR